MTPYHMVTDTRLGYLVPREPFLTGLALQGYSLTYKCGIPYCMAQLGAHMCPPHTHYTRPKWHALWTSQPEWINHMYS